MTDHHGNPNERVPDEQNTESDTDDETSKQSMVDWSESTSTEERGSAERTDKSATTPTKSDMNPNTKPAEQADEQEPERDEKDLDLEPDDVDQDHGGDDEKQAHNRDESERESTSTAERASHVSDEFDRDRLVTYLHWGGLVVFAILAVIAGAGLYSSLGSIIDVWVASQYQPIARAGVNLAILCGAVGGVIVILRTL